MPQTRANKMTVPVNADAYNLTADLATTADSANVVIPVASQAERDALTKKAGLCVARTDLPGCPIERCDGTNWFGIQHVEFTFNTPVGNIPNNSIWGVGAITLDSSSATTDSTIASVPASTSDKIAITSPGTYAIHYYAALGTAVTAGNSWVQIKDSADSTTYSAGPFNEFWATTSIPAFRVTAANTVLWFRLKQTSGGTNNSAGRIRITKVG